MKNLLWLIFFLSRQLLFAQVELKQISPEIEKTLLEAGYDKMREAWLVTGNDTVYRFRFQKGQQIARKTPFDADTVWQANDSSYHFNTEIYGERSFTVVYYGGHVKRKTRFEKGKVASADHWQHDSLGREIYHREWYPDQTKTTIKHSSISTEYIFESAYNDGKTIRKQHGDTNRVWLLQGQDTSSHRFSWENYAEEKRYKPIYLNRQWHTENGQIQTVRTEEIADSSVIITYEDEREMWQYHFPVHERMYQLYQYTKVTGLVEPKRIFTFYPQSDTTRYKWETYALMPNGLYRKQRELRLNKDSARYRKIDYFWKENGEIDHLEITNRWGIKRTKSVVWNTQILGCGTGIAMARNQNQNSQVEYRIDVKDEGLTGIFWGNEPLEQIIAGNLEVSEMSKQMRIQGMRSEILLFVIDETSKVIAIQKASVSELDTRKLKFALGESSIGIPPEKKTIFYFSDDRGVTHQKQMSYTLLPIAVVIK